MTAVPARLERVLRGPDSPTQQLAAALARRPGTASYLVGGSVRDALLDRSTIVDVDITTDARPDAIERPSRGWADAVWLQGQRFGTVGCEKDGERFEITTFRADVYRPESRKPEVTFSDDIETDLSRRDFTVNAMAIALDPTAAELVDPFDGLADLAARRLRTPLSPEISFEDDPLRMLRAARFVATLGFEPDAGARRRDRARCTSRLEIVSAERIRDELSKLLVADDPSAGLWLIARTGLVRRVPARAERDAARTGSDPPPQGRARAHDRGRGQDVAAADAAARRAPARRRASRARAATGRRASRSIITRSSARAWPASGCSRCATRTTSSTTSPKLVELHLRFHTYRMGWTDSAVRRYVRDAGPLLDDLNELTRCDCTTRNAQKAAALGRRMDELEARIAELREQEELAKIRPALDGNAVMQFLGVAPGPDRRRGARLPARAPARRGPDDRGRGARERLRAWAERERGVELPGRLDALLCARRQTIDGGIGRARDRSERSGSGSSSRSTR